jgi:AbrB family looped-hinge helix DNA binding protein
MDEREAGVKATVAERGQVTIPKPLREKLGIRPGTRLDFKDDRGKLVAVKVSDEDPVGRVFGCLGGGLKTDAMIRSLRGRA